MSPEPLKLRDGLVVSRQETSGGAVFILKDPGSSRFFRLREPEFCLARQLDGRTTLEVARHNVEERFAVTISLDTVEKFVGKLRQVGLLDLPDARSDRSTRVRGSLFYLRLKAFDPDRLFDRLVGKIGFVFTPSFLVSSAGLILLALGTSILHWDEITRDVARLYRFQALVLAWVTLLAVTVAHECAHGLTCKRFGGRVHEMGFLLLYFQPALYCNVSDAWLFPEKSRRLWVMFAGAYLDLCVWALATVVWRLTDAGTMPNYLALVIMVSSAVKTFFNLNPLLKLDGYYLLSDYLELPNLRQRALAYLRTRIWWFGGETSAPTGETSRRERRVYLAYGVLAALYSMSLLWVIAANTAS